MAADTNVTELTVLLIACFVFVPANLINILPSLTVHPGAAAAVMVGWDFLWRQNIHDAVYGSR